ncbi:MAG: hypothetical protein ACJ8IR_03175 [Alphaproteobacteria bacterium]|jgi:hypothetical protein
MKTDVKETMKINVGDLRAKLGQYRTQESLFRTRAVSAVDSQIRAELMETANSWRLLAQEAASLICDLAPDSSAQFSNSLN